MTVPLYNAALHNIGLGGYGFMLVNYNKRMQEQSIERVRVGTGDLVGNERLSFWTQDDYSGGEFQYEWGDPGMVARTDGIVPNPFGKSVRTIPDIVGMSPVAAFGASNLPFNNVPINGYTYGTSAFFCFANGVAKVTVAADGTPATAWWTVPSSIQARSYYLDRETSRLYVGTQPGLVFKISTVDMLLKQTIDNIDADEHAISGSVNAIGMFGDKLMAAFGRTLYLLGEGVGTSAGQDFDEESLWHRTGSTKSVEAPSAGVLPAKPIQMVPYNGQMYVLCGNAYNEGFVASSTGQDVITVCELPYAITPRCLAQYNGRLFIGGGGYDLAQNEHYGELHELSGTSLRLVRTFKREADTKRQRVQTIRWMDVQEGLLWFPGANGYSLACYDAATDGFFTGPSIPPGAVYGSPQPKVEMILGYRNLLLAWLDHTDATNRGIWRTRMRPADVVGGVEYSFVDTSDFGPEPARMKIWSEVAVETRFGGVGSVQASTDGGLNWTNLPSLGETASGNLYVTRFSLRGTIAPSTRIRLRMSIAQPGWDQAAELVSHTLGFLFADSGKHGWQLAIACTWNLELEHTGPEVEGPAAEGETAPPFERLGLLWGWADSRQPVAFYDRDFTTHQVVLTQCVETETHMNPKNTRETIFSTYLVEV